MQKYIIIVLLFFSFFLLNAQDVFPIQKEIHKVYNSKAFKRDSSYIINISYPKYDETKGDINLAKYLNSLILEALPGDTVTVEEAVEGMIDFYKSIETQEEFGMYWIYQNEIATNLLTDSIITLNQFYYEYTGGAHGMGGNGYMNINTKTCQIIKLEDLLIPGGVEEITKIAEKIFRKKYELGNQNLTEAGYWFENDKFLLNDNFIINKDNLTFLFNTYEIASYANGFTEIVIPYSEIKHLFKKDGLMKFAL